MKLLLFEKLAEVCHDKPTNKLTNKKYHKIIIDPFYLCTEIFGDLKINKAYKYIQYT